MCSGIAIAISISLKSFSKNFPKINDFGSSWQQCKWDSSSIGSIMGRMAIGAQLLHSGGSELTEEVRRMSAVRCKHKKLQHNFFNYYRGSGSPLQFTQSSKVHLKSARSHSANHGGIIPSTSSSAHWKVGCEMHSFRFAG